MKSYLLKTFIVTLFSSLIIYIYYIIDPRHSLGFSGTGGYLCALGFIYICYKVFYIALGYKKIIFTPIKIIYWFLLHLLLLCGFFFVINGLGVSNALILFIKILLFTFIPFFGSLIFYGFGKKLLSFYKPFLLETGIFTSLVSIGFGFFSFLFLLTIFGAGGFYNSFAVLAILGLFSIVSYKQILKGIQFLFTHKIKFENHNFASNNISEKYNPFLLSTEFLFIIVSGLIAINFISVFRPFPIGWDDLGVYMNYPKLISEAGSLLPLGQMFSWQLFTGIGFLFESQTLAFFLNSFTSILAGTGIYLCLYSLISENAQKKTYINIPLLGSTIFLAMPMVIFQVAKDMKLDIGLFFFSLIPLYILYYIFSRREMSTHSKLFYIAIAGLLAGLCFSIKVTSLLFIISFIAVLFFAHLGISGLLGYLAIFFALFTKLQLWDMMNVVYPKENLSFINTFSLTSFVLGWVLLIYAAFPRKLDNGILLLKKLAVFIIAAILALSPWFIKNISEVGISNISSVKNITSGKSDRFKMDYSTIYTTQELENIENIDQSERMKNSGTTDNEDFGRYFGYETGINNYMKLPWNLSMQVNQGGEFTNITYIFLALLPALLLFLPYRFKYISYTIVGVLVLELCLFLNLPSQKLFTDLFARFDLPGGYAVILSIMLLPLFFFKYTLKSSSHLAQLFLINLVFTIVYVFLWNISAFGVVWYGIVMYLCFICMIAICFYYLSSYKSGKNNYGAFFSSVVIFTIVGFYFVYSSIPHMMQNLTQAGYPEYKLGAVNEDESVFMAHPDYFPILFELNISDSQKQDFFEDYKKEMMGILDAGEYSENFSRVLNGVNNMKGFGEYLRNLKSVPAKSVSELDLRKQVQKLNREVSHDILYPTPENRNQLPIYRAGTFLKYYISENNKRLFEDNLLTKFNKYFYNVDVNTTAARLKDGGFDYLLVDLNAATIDKDPRKLLTQRYENMLKTFTSDRFELIETDNMCLQVALEKYTQDQDMSDYLNMAGTNYDSNTEDGIVSRAEKVFTCYDFILNLIIEEKINAENYSYLSPFYRQFEINEIDINNQKEAMVFLQRFITSGYKVLFKIQ